MKKVLLFSCFLYFSVGTFMAQNEVRLSVFSGMGKIASVHSIEDEVLSGTKISDRYLPAFNLLASYMHHFKHFQLETGLGFSQIKGEQRETFNLYTDMTYLNFYRMEVITERKSKNLYLPITAHFQVKKFNFGIGGYSSFLLTDSYFISFYRDDEPEGLQGGGKQLKSIDFGINAQMGYDISDKLRLNFSVLHGLNNVNSGSEKGAKYFLYQLSPQERTLKNHQILIGLNYQLFAAQSAKKSKSIE